MSTLHDAPDDDRYVGVAHVPSAPPAPSDDERFLPVAPPRPRRLAWAAALITCAVIVLSIGIMLGFALRSPGPVAPGAVPAVKTPAAKSPTPVRDSPRTVTQRYLNAVTSGDQATGDAQLCSLLRGAPQNNSDLDRFHVSDLLGMEVAEGRVDGHTATVDVTISVPIIGSTKFAVHLVDEQGAWKVCGFGPA
jgi:hypothetical protein